MNIFGGTCSLKTVCRKNSEACYAFMDREMLFCTDNSRDCCSGYRCYCIDNSKQVS